MNCVGFILFVFAIIGFGGLCVLLGGWMFQHNPKTIEEVEALSREFKAKIERKLARKAK